jgi:hypothetical protein
MEGVIKMKRPFKLFMCCLGNGTTVCNSAVMENGDYKTIAHISPAGNITFYVDESYIPAEDMTKIRNIAKSDAEKFRHDFEMRDELTQYSRILDSFTTSMFLEATNDKRPLSEKLPELREKYYRIA